MSATDPAQLARYLGFLQSDPNNVPLLIRTVELCLTQRDYEQAGPLLERLATLAPEDPKAQYFAGMWHLNNQDYDDAQQLFEQIMDAGIDSPGLRYNLALCQLYNHEPEKALANLQHLQATAPTQVPQAQLLLARALHHAGDTGQALIQVEHYLEKHSDSVEAQGYRALLLLDHSDENAPCLTAANKALESDSENPEALIVLGTLALEQYELQQAEKYFERVMKRNPNSGRAWLAKGIIALARGDETEAERWLLKTIEVMPRHMGTRVALGWAQIALQDLNAAEATFQEAIRCNRTFGESHAGLAVVWFMLGRFDEASERTKLAKRLSPNSSISVQYAEALLTHLDGNVEKARRMGAELVNSPVTPGGPQLRKALVKLGRQRRTD